MNKMKIEDLEFLMSPMVTFYDVLSFDYNGDEYHIQCQLCGGKTRASRIAWYQNGKEYHSDRFSIAYSAIISAVMESLSPSNTISWSIAKDKLDITFSELKEFSLCNHLKYMMGLYYDVAKLALVEENEKLFSNVRYFLEED